MLLASDFLSEESCAFMCRQCGLSFVSLWLLCCVGVVVLLRCVGVFSCCARLSFGRFCVGVVRVFRSRRRCCRLAPGLRARLVLSCRGPFS